MLPQHQSVSSCRPGANLASNALAANAWRVSESALYSKETLAVHLLSLSLTHVALMRAPRVLVGPMYFVCIASDMMFISKSC